jgi:hypothetical protein
MGVSGHLHAPAPSSWGKRPRYAVEALGGRQSRSGRFGEEVDLLLRPGVELRTVQPVA